MGIAFRNRDGNIRLYSIHKLISNPSYCEDMFGICRFFLKLSTEVGNEIVNRPGGGDCFITPDLIQQIMPVNRLSFVFTDSPTASLNLEVPLTSCTDREGNNYKVVKLGSLFWMAENLKYLPKVNKVLEESLTDPYYYVYGYDGNNVSSAKATENYQKWGALYNWGAAKKSCPSSWRLPTDDEWMTLSGQWI